MQGRESRWTAEMLLLQKKCWAFEKHWLEKLGGNLLLPPYHLSLAAFTPLTPTGWLHLLSGPCGRKDVGSAAPICLPDCPCANTAVVSWGERRLITDCSLFLPASLREPDAVNWTATPWGRVSCWWDWPLPHENCIICQKIFPTALLSMRRSFPCGTLSQGRCSPVLPCNLLLSNPLKLLF